MRKVILFLTVVAAISFIVAGGLSIAQRFGFLESSEKTMINQEKTLEINGIKEIIIDADDANVYFNPVDSNSVKIIFSGEVVSTNKEVIPQLLVKEESDKLTIEVNRKKAWTLYYKNDLSLFIDIPQKYEETISISASSADVILKELAVDKFMYYSDSGSINLDNIAIKDVFVETSSGKVTFSNFSGNVNVKSDAGDVRIAYKCFDNIVNIETSSGNTELIVPENSEFSLEAKTITGKINNSYPMELINSTENQLIGGVGNSENKIVICSESGDISISK
ncbi:DUF4097 family beta strand repeat-containing protein [Acetivibrio clariflavus]|uniref:DUF4097 domain-containing protein n=1 Tax=Acetivibrio clariflavus (strain DSM 19732 / NBRC 101661 / EBR45) TaxID=720554 RepID=G8M1M0_ACECE|nr:DUF4097 family beta strand repeat-containing protein [Acetivibrio clariflavus]AEV70249.1 hypothetical protein Clocl_3799 [Acetivibrio clariflavus DSM 19732]